MHLAHQPLLPVLHHIKLAKGAVCPITQLINEDVNEHWPQYQPLTYANSNWPPAQF